MIQLNNVYFDFDKAELKPDSYLELDRLVELLVGRITLKVGLSGHTDNIGSNSYNMVNYRSEGHRR
jgi:OmpA-OmpF porin, OOP family